MLIGSSRRAWPRSARAPLPLLLACFLGSMAFGSAFGSMPGMAPSTARGASLGTAPASPLPGMSTIIRESNRGLAAPEGTHGPSLIHLGAGYTIDPAGGDPTSALPATLRGTPPGPAETGYYLIQLRGSITEEDRHAIESAGGRIISYIPEYAFLTAITGSGAARLAASPRVAWTGLYHPAYKLSATSDLREFGRHEFDVLLFPDGSMDTVRARIAVAGGVIGETTDNGINKLIRIDLDTADLDVVARIPAVAWIERHRIPQAVNDQCQWVVQTWTSDSRRLWNLGLKGEGQVVNVVDTGIHVTHNQFFDVNVPLAGFNDYPTHRKIIAYKKAAPTINIGWDDENINTYHGTHTSGTVAGDDAPNANDSHDGIAIHSKLYFMDAGGYPTAGIFVPQDMNDLYIHPYTGNAGGAARISSNSWGSTVNGAYDLLAMTVDQFAWNHPDFLFVFANGNEGAPGTVISPATSKNCVAAGGTGNGTQAVYLADFESRGPARDGRRKPTICSPAYLVSAYGGDNTGYWQLAGTSMATPCMSGAAALIRQYLTTGWYPTGTPVLVNAMPDPSAALLKAMTINSAEADINGYTVPDNNIGWGRIDDDQVCYFNGDARRLALVDNTRGLVGGEYVEYQVYVASGSLPLKAALVWTDYPGVPFAGIELVNNLNLTATDGTHVYKGSVYSGGHSVEGGAYDNLNVEECVRLDSPAAGLWTFRIDAANVPFGPQPFALVVTGALGSDAGVVSLDKPAYNGNDTVTIRVIDTNAGGAVTVRLSGATEPGGEDVALHGLSGVYTGTIPLTLETAASGDGRLSVSDGDLITATYIDSDPGGVLTATAAVNISGPAISDVHALTSNETDLTIGWSSTAPSNSNVYYGTTPSLGSESEVSATHGTSHAVQLSGLQPNTLYYYDVESFDLQGNGVRDDNGGLHYTASTDMNRDVLLVIGNNSFPNKQSYLNALARSGWTYTIWEGSAATVPYVGNLVSGMASYKTVIWQPGFEQYPVFTDAARDSLARLDALGSRLAVFSHDVAWDFSDPSSPDHTQEREDWFRNQLKAVWQYDPPFIYNLYGEVGDPISGPYTSGVSYTTFRQGGAGDEVDASQDGGSGANVWNDGSDEAAVRWTASGPVGDPTGAVWGGTPRKVASNFYEWSQINVADPDDPVRADILNRTLLWLIGHNHPAASVVGPNGGEVFTGTTVPISWNESVDTGYTIATRKLYYSENGGDTWTLITAAAGPSPYNWNIDGAANGAQYRVRVVLSDSGTPPLSTADASNGNFVINRPGGDSRGPIVLAGSIASAPDPIRVPEPAVLSATVSDVYTGNAMVAAAEWSIGPVPVAPGSGTPMVGAFNGPFVAVTANLETSGLPPGVATFWVRGMDAAGNWGNAGRFVVQVNGGTSAVDGAGLPVRFALHPAVPNPFAPRTEIRFDLPRAAGVRLEVFDISGRRVRTLAEGVVEPGTRVAVWDGRDGAGNAVGSGTYLLRLEAGSYRAVRKVTLLR